MTVIPRLELAKWKPAFGRRLGRIVDADERATFRTLIVHAGEFIGDFARYSGLRGVNAAFLVALGTLLEGVGLFFLIPMLAIVLDTDEKTGWLSRIVSSFFHIAGTQTHFGKLALLLSLFMALVIFRALISAKRDVALTELQTGFVQDIRTKVAIGLAAARWDYVAKLRHTRITHVMSGGMQNIDAATNFLLQCGVSLTLILGQYALAFVLSPMFALLTLVLLTFGGVALGFTMRRARAHGLFFSGSNLTLLNGTAQLLGGMKLAASQNLQRRFIAEFERSLQDHTSRQVSYARRRANAAVAATSISAAAAALIVLIGLGVMDVGASRLLAMLYLFTRMTAPMLQLQHGAQIFAVGLPEYEKIKELRAELGAASSPIAVPEGVAEIADGSIAFRDVTFSYSSKDDTGKAAFVLQEANLSVGAGDIVGVFGRSGEGKTTFVDLLVGLFPPRSGEIRIGGAVLCDAILAAWRDRVSYVAQDAFLLHDTIRRNLMWSAPRAREEDLWEALRIVGADGLVAGLTDGLDTVVGERGMLVSGGERQRLAIARALLRVPRLLILDEATNALDQESEAEIIRRVSGIASRPTIIMIAHRIESIRLCERIVKLEGGRFVEIETPDSRSAYVRSSAGSLNPN